MSIPFFVAGGVMTVNPANTPKPEIGRLQFGNSQHIELVNSAPRLLAAHRDMNEIARRVNRRRWAKPGKPCAKCGVTLQQGDVQVCMGRRVFHDRCIVAMMVAVRRDLRKLGYNVEALHADPS
jgi:hypothetical protein